MRVPIELLKDESRFRLLCELDFGEVLPFVMKNIRRPGPVSLSFLLVNLAGLVAIALCIITGLSANWFTWRTLLWQLPAGIFCGSTLVIPFHELLHGLAYRILGARKIVFGADLAQFIFFVTAKKHPVSGIELYFLALFPFLVINALVISLIAVLFPGCAVCLLFLLVSHNLMCIGDFAIMNYACLAKTRIYSYDDPEKRICYFFGETTNPPGAHLRS